MTVEEWLGKENQLGIDIWNKKYRYNNESFDEWLDRVSGGNIELKTCIIRKEFIFGGRILAGRGIKENKVSLSNCYVVTPPEDDLDSIFECAKKMAKTYSRGGGCGTDLSKLAPKGATIRNAAKTSDGITAFMKLYSQTTGIISQSGRRGAAILTVDCTHPDLEDFINLKSDLNECTFANISVKVTDEFMKAVIEDKDWKLSFTRQETGETIEKTVKAKDILMLIAKRNWEMAEPGLLYWDRIKSWNMLNTTKEFEYVSTNPCGEIPMGAGMSCLLGSINLDEFVLYPFTNLARFDYDRLRQVTKIAVRALNKVLDEGQPLHPLEEQRNAVRDWRQIGLGTTSLATALIRLGLRYDKADSIITKIYTTIKEAAIEESIELAKQFGPYPKCNKEAVANSSFLPNKYREEVKTYGIRNCQLLTCAPNGSIGTMIGTGSTGAEPVFAFSYKRTTKSLHNEDVTYDVFAPIVTEYRKLHPEGDLPDYFIASEQIAYKDRVHVQGLINNEIDGSISSTVNLPESATVEDIYNLYIEAWKSGCKGCTCFRNNCNRTAILSTDSKKKDELKEITDKIPVEAVIARVPDNCIGKKRTLVTGCGTLHLTAFFDRYTGRLYEAYFSKGSQGGCQNFMIGLSRMVSLSARAGVAINAIIDQLKSSGTCPSYAVRRALKEDTSVGSSCPVAIGNALMEMYAEMQKELGECFGNNSEQSTDSVRRPIFKRSDLQKKIDNINKCPECGAELINEGGCVSCRSCGYSRCG